VRKAKAPSVVWIADVLVSSPVAGKISGRHGLDPGELTRLVRSPPARLGTLVRDARGTRLYVKVRTAAGQSVLVVLSPLSEDIWRVTSAYLETRQWGHDE
jgi:hypothetical protein